MSQDHPGVFVSEEIDFQRISVHRFFLPVPGDVTWAGEHFIIVQKLHT